MNTFTIGEIVYQFGITNDTFVITVINRMICEEYTLQIENTSSIFEQHPIIKNIEILETVIKDGFNNKPNVILEFDSNDTVRLVNVVFYGITITVDAVYIKDVMVLKLPFIEKHITPKQVTDHIEYRFQQYIPEVKEVIAEVEESINKECSVMRDAIDKQTRELQKTCDVYSMLVKKIEEHERAIKKFDNIAEQVMSISEKQSKRVSTIEQLNRTISTLMQSQEKIQKDFTEYIEFNPIMTIVADSDRCQFTDSTCTESCCKGIRSYLQFLKRIMFNEKTMTAQYKTPIYWYDSKFMFVDFDTNKFKYLKQLEQITFDGCEFQSLDFLAVTPSVKSVTIINMPKLTTISHLAQFPNIEQITISRVCNVKDLCTLTKCKQLKTLTLAKGTNTGCFPEIIDFKIIME